MAENHLKRLIDQIADAFENDKEFDVDKALVVIEQTKKSLKATHWQYQKACPPEGTAAAECLSGSVALFYGALSSLEEYTDTCEDALLDQARNESNRACQLLEQALDWAQSIAETNNPEQPF